MARWSEKERYFFTCKETKYVKGGARTGTGTGRPRGTGKEKPVAVAVPARGGGQAQAQRGHAGVHRLRTRGRGRGGAARAAAGAATARVVAGGVVEPPDGHVARAARAGAGVADEWAPPYLTEIANRR